MWFTGDLGWERHCQNEGQAQPNMPLFDAGKAFDASTAGSRALMSLPIEKVYGSWSREYSPQDVSLDRLCKIDKS
ncbi:MAG: hypothetical protein V7695_24530 [Sulfitobacter sp.]